MKEYDRSWGSASHLHHVPYESYGHYCVPGELTLYTQSTLFRLRKWVTLWHGYGAAGFRFYTLTRLAAFGALSLTAAHRGPVLVAKAKELGLQSLKDTVHIRGWLVQYWVGNTWSNALQIRTVPYMADGCHSLEAFLTSHQANVYISHWRQYYLALNCWMNSGLIAGSLGCAQYKYYFYRLIKEFQVHS